MSVTGRAVLDASAVLALIHGEKGWERLTLVSGNAVVSAVNAGEVLAKLVSRGMPLRKARAAFDALHLEVVPFSAEEGVISAAYVRPGVSLGDRCFSPRHTCTGPAGRPTASWQPLRAICVHPWSSFASVGERKLR